MYTSNLGGWMGHPSYPYHCIAISIILSLTHLGTNLKSWTFEHQITKVVTFVPSNIVLHSISNTYKVKCKWVFRDMYKMYFKVQSQLNNAPKHIVRAPKHYTHTICEWRWYTKPKNVDKVVKGLPHMCPCHQPNPKRGLVTYTRWITT